ncbi:MAG: bacillithiol biosynthesis cysteine-adding enzyme BshC [Bacteroidia bacterium]|nr:bacillithiol biosynthesis cysteine-adding enzyme BshC [Bacteroidia bacterium]
MLKKTSVDLKTSGVLNKLVSDYLDKESFLRPYYSFFPDKNGYRDILKTKPYQGFDRKILTKILNKQSLLTSNTSEKSLANIELLNNDSCYTITTGHQLCLFTGPLYFLYKIISAINLAEKLKIEFPANDFVPVYWMASEDHDFPEVNNFHFQGKKIEWNSEQQGAVGDFITSELKSLSSSFEALLGKSENSAYLTTLFEKSYLEQKTLADATRYLVNELFGEYGIVVLDGNDSEFKQQFKEHFKRDIFDNKAYLTTASSISSLQEKSYQIQVNPRLINCFYLEKGSRLRIEKQNEQFNLVGTDRVFSRAELEKIIDEHPEQISPNVVLRPLYQQVILPNLAYIGGPGELAYWLEFKSFFDESGVLFPILTPRNFVSIIDKVTAQKINKLGLSVPSIYKSEQELIKEIQLKNNAYFELGDEEADLRKLYDKILKRTAGIDKTLEGSVSAELKRSLNGFSRMSAKANKAQRRKLETELKRIRDIKGSLFPNGVPQERYENFSSFYLSFGKNFIEMLKDQLDPIEISQTVLLES